MAKITCEGCYEYISIPAALTFVRCANCSTTTWLTNTFTNDELLTRAYRIKSLYDQYASVDRVFQEELHRASDNMKESMRHWHDKDVENICSKIKEELMRTHDS